MADSIKGANRKLKMILMLQSQKEITATTLAKYFGVSKRTIFRDLRALSEMNVPITHDPDFGYSLVSGYKIPPLMFTEKELATVMMGLSFMKSQPQQSMKSDADEVFLKISNSLPADLSNFSSTLQKKVVVSPYSKNLPEYPDDNNWFQICKSITDKQRLHITYTANNNITGRDLDPYFLVYYKDHWNVLGYCHLRKAPRVFILNNMSNIQSLPEKFTPEKGISLEDILYSSNTKQITYKINVNESKVHTFLFDLPGRLIHIEDSTIGKLVEFSFDKSDNSYILEWLTTFLQDITIIEPESLKRDLKHHIKEALKSL